MKFYNVLIQVVGRLVLEGRVSYRALQRDFELDDAILEDLREELIVAKQIATDEDGRVLVWREKPRFVVQSDAELLPSSTAIGTGVLSATAQAALPPPTTRTNVGSDVSGPAYPDSPAIPTPAVSVGQH